MLSERLSFSRYDLWFQQVMKLRILKMAIGLSLGHLGKIMKKLWILKIKYIIVFLGNLFQNQMRTLKDSSSCIGHEWLNCHIGISCSEFPEVLSGGQRKREVLLHINFISWLIKLHYFRSSNTIIKTIKIITLRNSGSVFKFWYKMFLLLILVATAYFRKIFHHHHITWAHDSTLKPTRQGVK